MRSPGIAAAGRVVVRFRAGKTLTVLGAHCQPLGWAIRWHGPSLRAAFDGSGPSNAVKGVDRKLNQRSVRRRGLAAGVPVVAALALAAQLGTGAGAGATPTLAGAASAPSTPTKVVIIVVDALRKDF